MVGIKNEGIVLEPLYDFEAGGVLNPACIAVGDEIWMYYRAVDRENVSTIGFCRLKDGAVIERRKEPILWPEHDYEIKGLEDPRIVQLGQEFFLFYVGYDGKNAQIAYAKSEKLPDFEKKGLVLPELDYEEAGKLFEKTDLTMRYKAFEMRYRNSHGQDILMWEKDAFLFPEKIDGKYALFHRVLPGIQIVFFDSFGELSKPEFWQNYLKKLDEYTILEPKYWYDDWNVGGGCPPIKTEAGWLLIYHGVEYSTSGHVYHACAALLDLENPLQVIGRLKEPLFSPVQQYEKNGVVNNVVFPTSALIDGDRLNIYYGAGDRVIAMKSLKLAELLEELKENIQPAPFEALSLSQSQ